MAKTESVKPNLKRAKPIRAAITAVHGYVPPHVLTNAELARLVDTSDAWITERTGIKERHILKGEGLGTSHMGAEAVRGLLQKTNTAPKNVDLLICATTTPDFVFPSTANLICDMVGIRNIGSFDVQAACSGFIYALSIATQFIENGSAQEGGRGRRRQDVRRSSTTPTARPACCSATAPAPCCSSRPRTATASATC